MRVICMITHTDGWVGQQRENVMKSATTIATALMMSAFLVSLSGCDRQEGPAEQAGEEVDQATEKAGERIEEAGERIQDSAQGDDK
jgi:hypothetical protein